MLKTTFGRSRRNLPVACAVLAFLCGCKSKDSPGVPDAGVPPVATVPAAVKQVPPCDADAAWFAIEADTPALRREQFVAVVRGWSADCRAKAMTSACDGTGCTALVSDALTEGAADSAEVAALRRIRRDGNRASVANARPLLKEVRQFADYALRIRSSPRSSAYRRPGMSNEELARAIVDGDPCMARMKKDFARVRELEDKIVPQIPLCPSGTILLRQAVSFARSCVDCSDNRISCDDLKDPLASVETILRDHEALIAKDSAVVGTK